MISQDDYVTKVKLETLLLHCWYIASSDHGLRPQAEITIKSAILNYRLRINSQDWAIKNLKQLDYGVLTEISLNKRSFWLQKVWAIIKNLFTWQDWSSPDELIRSFQELEEKIKRITIINLYILVWLQKYGMMGLESSLRIFWNWPCSINSPAMTKSTIYGLIKGWSVRTPREKKNLVTLKRWYLSDINFSDKPCLSVYERR